MVSEYANELDFAKAVDQFDDVVSFARNSGRVAFKIEYRAADKRIADYFPDFIVKTGDRESWIVETKGASTSRTRRNGVGRSNGAKTRQGPAT